MTGPVPAVVASPRRAHGRRVTFSIAGLAAALAAGIVAVAIAGCAQTTRTGSLAEPLAEYDRGRFEEANRAATDVMMRSSGRTRDEATYLSGLSAYRLGRLEEAELRLTAASRSADPRTAANASATLGLVRLDQNRPAEAADLFAAAAAQLDGEDANRAERYAAAATRLAGDRGPARRPSRPGDATGAGGAPPGPPTSSVSDDLYGGYGYRARREDDPRAGAVVVPAAFALQVGAFRERARADQAARDAAAAAARAGAGAPRVVPRLVERGLTLYVVQFGRFRSRAEASRARERAGNLGYIVAPYADAAR